METVGCGGMERLVSGGGGGMKRVDSGGMERGENEGIENVWRDERVEVQKIGGDWRVRSGLIRRAFYGGMEREVPIEKE